MLETIQKEARKASADPVQEALRQHKDTWNHEASLLIAQLIAFKRGLNGRGEPKVGLPPSSIKDPLPSEVGNYLDQLADRYNKLISDAHGIIDEQNHYSEGRNKGSKENQVSASSNEEIEKFASWWGSRAKTYGKNSYVNPWYWFAAKEEAKIRMKLLKISADFISKLKDIDSYIVSKDNKAIPNGIYEFDRFISAYSHLMIPNMEKLIKIDKVILPKSIENKSDKPSNGSESSDKPNESENKQKKNNIPENGPTIEQENGLKDESKKRSSDNIELSGEEKSYALGLSTKEMSDDLINIGPISIIIQKLYPKDNNTLQKDNHELRKKIDQFLLSGKGDIDKIQLEYANLLKLSNSILKLNSQNFSSQLKDIENIVNVKSASISPEFAKFASNFMSRWLKRQKLKIMPNSNDRIRLLTSDKIKITLSNINSFQNSLENNDHLNMILSEFSNLNESIGEIGSSLYHLGKNHNDEYEQTRLNGKPTTHLVKLEILNKLIKLKDHLNSEFSRINS